MNAKKVAYTTNQTKAIDCTDKDLQIIACAGSGKTQVISERIVNILKKNKSVLPENIVAFTFTEKAGAELKDRIHSIYKREFNSEAGLADMYVGTIHGWCLSLLQSPPVYKYLNHSILPNVQQQLFVDRYSNESGLSTAEFSAGSLVGQPLQRYKHTSLYIEALNILREGDLIKKFLPASISNALQKYNGTFDKNRYFDFAMVLNAALSEIRHNSVLRNAMKNNLRYLVVDEYQDVNPLQEKLIEEIKNLGANLCVVGDDDQTIYQWRGSDIENILTFSKRNTGVTTISLEENFRSSKAIVDIANNVALRIGNRLEKTMTPAGHQSYSAGDLETKGFNDQEEQAEWVAKKIKDLLGTPYFDKPGSKPRGLTYSDFAILVRRNKDSEPFQKALSKLGLNFIVRNTEALFDRPEVVIFEYAFYYLADSEDRSGLRVDRNSLKKKLATSILKFNESSVAAFLKYLDATKEKIQKRAESKTKVVDAEIYLQEVYLNSLHILEITEEKITSAAGPDVHAENIFYNLGQFSQVVTDYEQIHFNSHPIRLYQGFASFLKYHASEYYKENTGQDGFETPNAILITTIHSAKGMQWPAVFLPDLTRNKFPSKRIGGLSVWHVLPAQAVKGYEQYRGTMEDERRLLYVAITRAEKFLFCTWAQQPTGNNLYSKPSDFFKELEKFACFKDRGTDKIKKIEMAPRKQDISVELTFSELKYYFECPYQFKLRFLYNFNVPLNRAIGYGKSLHAALAELHAEAQNGNIIPEKEVPALIDRHLHAPFANKVITENLRNAAIKAVSTYLAKHKKKLNQLEYVEKPIELQLDQGVVVSGRVDLIRKSEEREIVIVDFKSNDMAQEESLSQMQLQIYAMGYEQASGEKVQKIEIHDLKNDQTTVTHVDGTLVSRVKDEIIKASENIKSNVYHRHSKRCKACDSCEVRRICETSRQKAA